MGGEKYFPFLYNFCIMTLSNEGRNLIDKEVSIYEDDAIK